MDVYQIFTELNNSEFIWQHDSDQLNVMNSSSITNYGNFQAANSVPCRDIHNTNSSDWCSFVTETASCKITGGFIDYTSFVYCSFSKSTLPLGMILLIVWLLFLFITMAVCADDFFCPPLVIIAKILRMSDNIAGVTLLAFGNGAADVFSSIAAIRGAQQGDVGLAIGALLGAGILLATVIAGSICIVTPCHMAERPFLRDVSFMLLSVFMSFFVLYDKKITLVESVGFLVIYFIYAVVVVIGRYIYQKQKKEPNPEENEDETTDNVSENQMTPPLENTDEITNSEAILITDSSDSRQPVKEFMSAINPLDERFMEAKWYKKIYLISKMPAMFILTICIPVVNNTKPKNGWNRHLNSLHCLITPLMSVMLVDFNAFTYFIGGHFPVYGLILLIGTAIGIVVFITSKDSEAPVYHACFAFLGFAAGVVWTDALATEIVNLLTTVGIVVNISSVILGLTLLAWGNSVADFIADFVMAMKGYPRAGLSACYGGPIFNILLGIGLPFVLVTATKGPQVIQFPMAQLILVASLLFILAATLVIVPIQKFVVGKPLGIFLLCFYAVFLILEILAETGVIKGSI